MLMKIDRLSFEELEPRTAPAPMALKLLSVELAVTKEGSGGGPPTEAPTNAADAATEGNLHVPWNRDVAKFMEKG